MFVRYTKFCRTCNCRDRIIEDHRCIVCGEDPEQDPDRPPANPWADADGDKGADWYYGTWGDDGEA